MKAKLCLSRASGYNGVKRFKRLVFGESIRMEYDKLTTGQLISDRVVSLDADRVALYVEAVDHEGFLLADDGGRLVPGMAVAAFALSGAINDLNIPGGTVHLSQEIQFQSAVEEGTRLDCKAFVSKNSVRNNWRILVIDVRAMTVEGTSIMKAKSTIMLPV